MESSSTNLSAKELDRAKILPVRFYERNTIDVAKDLLGKILVVRVPAGRAFRRTELKVLSAARIVETEAYRGDDPASHSSRGETPRCSVMFGPPGVAYVYFIYGMYEMLNFVTESKGFPGAVLIRAAEPVFGEHRMHGRRPKARTRHNLTSGPGKLCRALGIEMEHNGQSLRGPILEVRDDGFRPESISASGRVGINVAKDKSWRFFITDHPFVSRVRENADAKVLKAGRAD